VERHHFEAELDALKACVARMGDLVATRLEAALRGFSDGAADEARFVLDHDDDVNNLQIEIDERAMRLLALQQPAARDLRFITATIKANADLERIGDQAVNVAGNSLRLVGLPALSQAPVVSEMGRLAVGMVREALASFLNRDAVLARAVLERDDAVDALKHEVLRDRLRSNFMPELGEIVAPTLIVHGGADTLVPLKYAEEACRHIPDCRLEVLPGAGHWAQRERPAEFVRLVNEFLAPP
jgi:phosphate transport system protein